MNAAVAIPKHWLGAEMPAKTGAKSPATRIAPAFPQTLFLPERDGPPPGLNDDLRPELPGIREEAGRSVLKDALKLLYEEFFAAMQLDAMDIRAHRLFNESGALAASHAVVYPILDYFYSYKNLPEKALPFSGTGEKNFDKETRAWWRRRMYDNLRENAPLELFWMTLEQSEPDRELLEAVILKQVKKALKPYVTAQVTELELGVQIREKPEVVERRLRGSLSHLHRMVRQGNPWPVLILHAGENALKARQCIVHDFAPCADGFEYRCYDPVAKEPDFRFRVAGLKARLSITDASDRQILAVVSCDYKAEKPPARFFERLWRGNGLWQWFWRVFRKSAIRKKFNKASNP